MLIVDMLTEELPCPACGRIMEYCRSIPVEAQALSDDGMRNHPQFMHYLRCPHCNNGFKNNPSITKEEMITEWNKHDPELLEMLRASREEYIKNVPLEMAHLLKNITSSLLSNYSIHIS